MSRYGEVYNKLRDYQHDCMEAIFNTYNSGAKSSVAVLPMACLSGDTLINVNRGGGHRKKTIKNLAMAYGNYPKSDGVRGYNKSIKSKTRSYNGDTIGLKTFEDVVYAGVKETYTLTLYNGSSIRCTNDHKIQTDNGMVRLMCLSVGDRVMVDENALPKKRYAKSKRQRKHSIKVGEYHPYANRVNSSRDGFSRRVIKHILIFEANMNGMDIGEFIYATSLPDAPTRLLFVDTSKYHIHHVDHNHHNDDITNLRLMTIHDHMKLHATNSHFHQGEVEYSSVKSIEYYGYEETFDIIDVSETHNFSANGIIVSNSGKTYIVGAVLHNYLRNQPMKKVLMLSHLDILTRQNEESIRKAWGLRTGILQAMKTPRSTDNCIISTMQSFSKEDKVRWWGGLKDIGICVIDEAHLYGSKSYDDIVAMLPDDCLLLGVTATPFRENKDMTNMFESVAYTISMQELIDRKMLVPPVLNYVDIRQDEDTITMHKTLLNIYYKRHRGEKSVIFLRSIKECKAMEALANGVGLRAIAITSKLTGNKRDIVIDNFKNNTENSANILITVNVLTAGFSSDNIRSIFMPYKIGSVSAYLQRIGRGMRLDDNKDHVDIYVGGESPQLLQEFYEKVQKQALNAGRHEREDEFDPDDIKEVESTQQVEYSEETSKLLKELKTSSMGVLSSMITKKDFPQQLLDSLVKVKKGKNKMLSSREVLPNHAEYLRKNGINPTNMNQLEAVYALSAVFEAKGIPKHHIYVPEGYGTLSGKPYATIAPMQKRYIRSEARNTYYANERNNKLLYSKLNSL